MNEHLTKFFTALICPRCQQPTLRQRLTAPKPLHGQLVCAECKARYAIHADLCDFSGQAARAARNGLTLAGWSNHAPFAPQVYERGWRPHSLGWLTGGRFTTEQELRLLREWMPIAAGQLIVDLGSATGLYARTLAREASRTTFCAIDLAPGMLHAARQYAGSEDLKNIVYARAAAEQLPFADGSVDGLVCGGSLNEFRSMQVALREAARVCVPGGQLFAMSLCAAHSRAGQWAQRLARWGGIQFPELTAFNRLLGETGWRIQEQYACGVVVCTLLEKVSLPKRIEFPTLPAFNGLQLYEDHAVPVNETFRPILHDHIHSN